MLQGRANGNAEEIMRFGIPLLADRVAPRCTFADSVLVVSVKGRRIREESVVPLNGTTWADLVAALSEQKVETLICGGIAPATRESIRSRDVEVIENVAGTRAEVLDALARGRIRPGFGLSQGKGDARSRHWLREPGDVPGAENGAAAKQESAEGQAPTGREIPASLETPEARPSDCLECSNRVCLHGESCPYLDLGPVRSSDQAASSGQGGSSDGEPTGTSEPSLEARSVTLHGTEEILEAAWDVALEEERTLCRLAELVYFALEMGYRRIGVVFCEDLREPAAILTGVLRRFFDVVPIGCKARPEASTDGLEPDPEMGTQVSEPDGPCDPRILAEFLNARGTDLNVVVGLCVGADCVFNQSSRAPVTTVFVKDKSLANNPIGAVYSHYYLTEI